MRPCTGRPPLIFRPKQPTRRLQRRRETDSGQQAQRPADQPDHDRLAQDTARPGRGLAPTARSRAELAGALGHQHGERVGDDEHADEQADAGEHQQERC